MPESQRRKLKYFSMSLFCFKKGIVRICGWISASEDAGMRQSIKKKLLKKKDCKRKLQFVSCPTNVQAVLRETRRAEWKKWMSFNAGIISTDEYVRHFTEAGCEIFPMQRIEVGTSHRHSSWRWGFAQLCPQWVCTQAHVCIHACDFTTGYFSGEEIDWILLYRTPAEGIPEEGLAGGAIFASRVLIYGTNDEGRGLWLRLKDTCKQFNFPECNSADSVHASKWRIKHHCRDVFQCRWLDVWLILRMCKRIHTVAHTSPHLVRTRDFFSHMCLSLRVSQ